MSDERGPNGKRRSWEKSPLRLYAFRLYAFRLYALSTACSLLARRSSLAMRGAPLTAWAAPAGSHS
jgi:hypothetical protein